MMHGVTSMAAPANEQPRAQMRRIVCRMIGDIVQPWMFRSGNLQPWVPDFAAPSGRTRIAVPGMLLPPQCDVGFDPTGPVTWQDVLRLVPCMGIDSVLDRMEGSIRRAACLLPDDTLGFVNAGPQLAAPIPTLEPEFVKGSDSKLQLHPDSHKAPISLPPCSNRPIHAMVRQPVMRHGMDRRVIMRAPVAEPHTEQQWDANVAALQSLFHPTCLEERLVVSQQGMDDMLSYPQQTGAAQVFNALMVRQQVIAFLNEAMQFADYASTLAGFLPADRMDFTWADLRTHANLGQGFANKLVQQWPKIPIWTSQNLEQQPTDHHPQKGVLYFRPSLRFRPPAYRQQQAQGFLSSLLDPTNAFLVHSGSNSEAFWR